MKLTAFILLSACLTASAHGYSQKITLSEKNASLQRVFKKIQQQSGYEFICPLDLLQKAGPVTVELKEATLEEAVKRVLANKPLSYTISENTVVIKEKPSEQVQNEVIEKSLPASEITGKVTTKEGEPLIAASVIIKRTGKGTQTDANGKFKLTNVETSDVLIISYTGYIQQTVKVGDTKAFFLALEVATNELDQVVMQAYGTTSQRYSTGNIVKVSSGEIARQPISNVLQALQGRVPGLIVSQTNGFASAPFKVEIRGRNTIAQQFTSDPLYIIDGVPLTVLELGTANYNSGSKGFLQNGFAGPANGQSPLFSINPSDIESVEVLKDADATAIYGSRGANGVILITTKKGKPGKTNFNIGLKQGISKVTRYWDMLNTSQYLEMRREAFKNDNRTMTTGSAYDLLVWDTTRYTNWQKYLWGGMGRTTDAIISLSGGDSRTTFFVSAGYFYQTNILTIQGGDQRSSVLFNLNHAALNRRLTISFSSNYSISKSDMINLPAGASTLPPNAPSVYDSLGKLNWMGWEPVQSNFPFYNLLQPYTAKTNNLVSNLSLNYQVIKGLVIRSSFGFTNSHVSQVSLQPITSRDPTTNPTGSSQFGNNDIQNWIIEPQIEYNTFISKGKLNVNFGSTLQNNTTEGSTIIATGYSDDALLKSPSNAATTTSSSNYGQYRYAAIFGRINYNWRNKYILNLSARRDGSSRFGQDNQFGNFGAMGLAWIFSEEDIIKKLKFLSFGKMRSSYGITGGDQIGDYKYLTRWSANSNVTGLTAYLGYPSLLPLQHANKNYNWQENKKLEVAIDLGFLKDKFNLSVSWYRNRCGNQLVSFPLPDFTGFSSVIANSPALVQNSGWEFTIGAKVFDLKNFKWHLQFNSGLNENKLIEYPNLSQSPYVGVYEIGKSLNVRKLLHFTGVDPQVGVYTFLDKNRDGIITTTYGIIDDLFEYDLSPKFSGGLSNRLSFKNIELNLFFQFVKKTGTNAIFANNFPGTIANQPIQVLERWKVPGDITNIARFSTRGDLLNNTDNYFRIYSDGAFTDASFIRLQNVSLSYNLPEKLIKKSKIQNCSIYLQCQNLFVISKYKGIDPETQNFGGMPPSKIIVGGIQINF